MICQRDAPTAARTANSRARDAACGEKIGEVGTRDQEHEHNRAEQQVKTRAVITHLIFEQRSDGHAHSGV